MRSLPARMATSRQQLRQLKHRIEAYGDVCPQKALAKLGDAALCLDEGKVRIAQLERFAAWVEELHPQAFTDAMSKMHDGVRKPGIEAQIGPSTEDGEESQHG